MTSRLARATVIGGVALVLAAAVPASAQAAAVVVRERGADECWSEPGNLPFLPDSVQQVPIENVTVVITPKGGVNATCFGQLPEGIALPEHTFAAWVPCHSDEVTVTQGHIVVTTSGRITMTCHFPPP
ncbi:hypothetical protein SAMN04488107_3887 [Geodermatophilus saharensis]|uniref:Ig-like domain-containing protein n=1 Tax=Geodermatophilus saharensis TaxID=1137994 RepID=A0A239HL92_9ACTN|nr:hypothetical protein [Geodermatophilus saharensis]SNS81925.1 hypothetical protein SAMN04488107_3887 [Geodermatophilus saharensis]